MGEYESPPSNDVVDHALSIAQHWLRTSASSSSRARQQVRQSQGRASDPHPELTWALHMESVKPRGAYPAATLESPKMYATPVQVPSAATAPVPQRRNAPPEGLPRASASGGLLFIH